MSHTQTNDRRTKAAPSEAVAGRFQRGWLDRLDSRHNLTRELRERFDEVCTDLGGRDSLSYMQRSLIERALWLEHWLANQERELAKGQDLDVSRWIQAANSLQGIYSRLGLERRAKDAPSLHEYLRHREASA